MKVSCSGSRRQNGKLRKKRNCTNAHIDTHKTQHKFGSLRAKWTGYFDKSKRWLQHCYCLNAAESCETKIHTNRLTDRTHFAEFARRWKNVLINFRTSDTRIVQVLYSLYIVSTTVFEYFFKENSIEKKPTPTKNMNADRRALFVRKHSICTQNHFAHHF